MNEILEVFKTKITNSELIVQMQELSVTAVQYLKFLGILLFGILLLSSLARFLFGKKAQINQAVASAMEILFVYVIYSIIFGLGLGLQTLITPLPFVTMVEDYLLIFPILDATFADICSHVAKMLVIAFLVNLINGCLPKGEHVFTWFLLRLVTIIASVIVIYFADQLMNAYLPQNFADIAPTALLCALVALILLGSLKLIVGAAMAFLDPIVAALYTFFFSNIIGRALAKAMVTTTLLTGLVIALNKLKIVAVHVAASALTAYIPLLLIVLLLWYVVGHLFSKE